MAPVLVEPHLRYEQTFREAMAEFVAEGRDEELGSLPRHETFADFIRELADWSRGVSLPPGWVAGSSLWLVENDTFIGKVDIRHELTDALRLRGGHIGYAIRPSARRRGHGRMALSMALQPCLDLGLQQILVTCDTTNQASRRIIESNGGVFQDVVHVPGRAVDTMRYWIDIGARD